MSLNYKKIGKGQPLIILHGLFGSLDNWLSLGKYWSDKYSVYLVDQRNHGQSYHDVNHSYPDMAEDLINFIKEHKIDNPILLGHSMGGKTAMEIAVKKPQLIDKLIVVDIAPVKYQVHHYKIIEGLKSLDLDVIETRKEADEKLSQTIKEVGVRQFLLKNLYWESKGKLAWRFNLETLANQILPISEYAIAEGKFDRETLFIKGENSNYIVEESLNAIQTKFPKHKLVTIEGAGHWVHAERKEKFIEIVDEFLNQ